MFDNFYNNRRVLITGHSGFTGGWLWTWLSTLGAKLSGISLEPITDPSFFATLGGRDIPGSYIGDIRSFADVRAVFERERPEIVFHLAAQPLVRRSFRDPLESFTTNVTGTVNVLEAARHCESTRAFVCITTDKVYADDGEGQARKEDSRLGGADPYSASKVCAEYATQCYQQTMSALGNKMAIATVRGGNIIGGGDWSEDRLIPDFVRAMQTGEALVIRHPDAVRPWQHVLTACHGYMAVGHSLFSHPQPDAGAYNVGPVGEEIFTVRQILDLMVEHGGSVKIEHQPSTLKETKVLRLDITKIQKELGVLVPWGTEEVVRRTAGWYREFYRDQEDILAFTKSQISDYQEATIRQSR